MRNAMFRFARAIRTNALVGALFALPAIAISVLVVPSDVGYLFISTTVMVLFVSAKRVNTSDENRLDTQELSDGDRARLLGLLLASTVAGVTAQLLAVVALAELSAITFGPTLLPIGIAVLFPVVDRQLGDVHSWLSVGGIAAWLVFRAASAYYNQNATTGYVNPSHPAEEKMLY